MVSKSRSRQRHSFRLFLEERSLSAENTRIEVPHLEETALGCDYWWLALGLLLRLADAEWTGDVPEELESYPVGKSREQEGGD